MGESDAYSGVDNLEVMQEAANYNRYLVQLVRDHAPATGRIIDFGAGSGTFAEPIAKLGFDVTAVEPDTLLRDRLRDRNVPVAADVRELEDDSFAYAYTLNVLEHIPDDVDALRQLYLKLLPGGKLLIYVPAFPVLYTSMDAKVGHIRRYTRKTLINSVSAAGFSVERVAYVDSLGFFATLLFKLLGSKEGNLNRSTVKLYDRVAFPVSRMVDVVARHWFGKNLLLVARKKSRA